MMGMLMSATSMCQRTVLAAAMTKQVASLCQPVLSWHGRAWPSTEYDMQSGTTRINAYWKHHSLRGL